MKTIMRIAILAMALMGATQADAQLKNILKNVASSAVSNATSSNSTLSNLVNVATSVLGTSDVSESSLVGTWTYSEPCLAFESDNVLTKIGASAVSTKAQNTLAKQLTKLGFTKGKIVLTLKDDKSGTVAYNGKTVNVTWAVSGSNLSLTFPVTSKTVKMNAKMSGSSLQIAMSADKLVTLLSTISTKASTVSSSLSTVTTVLKNVKGAYVGLKFTK